MDLKRTKELNNDGHYFETRSGMSVAYARPVLELAKGIPRRSSGAHQRMENILLQSVPHAGSVEGH